MRGNQAWITFSSRRGYGDREGGGASQIWIAEVDMSLARQGNDPSRGAIRLPGQGAELDNHTQVWVAAPRD